MLIAYLKQHHQRSILCYVMILSLSFWGNLTNARDDLNIQQPISERSRLLDHQKFLDMPFDTDNEQIPDPKPALLLLSTPIVSPDIWRNIIFQRMSVNDSSADDPAITIRSMVALSCTDKGLHELVTSLDIYILTRDMTVWWEQSTAFLDKMGTDLKLTATVIRKMASLAKRQNDRSIQIQKRENSLKDYSQLSWSTTELWLLTSLKDLEKTIKAPLYLKIPGLLDYAKENPEDCLHDEVAISLGDLSVFSGHPIPPYQYNWRGEYKRIFQNKRLMIAMTLLLGTVFAYKGFDLYNQYPLDRANGAFVAMLNQTSKWIDDEYWEWWGDPMTCYKKYEFSQTSMGTWWEKSGRTKSGKPAQWYCYFPGGFGDSKCFDGNMTEWIQHMATQGGFDYSYWFNHVMSIYKGMKHDTRIALCSPNPDRTSISCGSAYTHKSQNTWNGFGDISLILTRGDAMCAHHLVIQGWQTMMKLYWGFGSMGSLLFVWLWLFHFLL